MKRFIILALTLIFIFIISCGDSGSDIETAKSTDTSVVDETITEETIRYIDTLPATDFGGETVSIIASSFGTNVNIPEDEETGDLINDAVLKRNRDVEERYNVKFVYYLAASADETQTKASASVLAGDSDYDIVIDSMYAVNAPMVQKGLLLSYDHIPYVDLDQSWWSKFVRTDLSIKGKVYFPTGEIVAGYFRAPYSMIFNKRLAENFNIENLYSLVLEYKWTIDKMAELMKDVALDLDGDGKMTNLDQYALGLDDVAGFGYFIAMGEKMTRFDEKGLPNLTLADTKTIETVEMLASIVGDKAIVIRGENYVKNEEHVVFTSGRSLFLANTFNNFYTFRDMTDDFGIIPLPMRNESQGVYYSYAQPWSGTGVTVPITNQNLEKTGLIIESLAYMSSEYLTPAMYEVTLKTKVARDNDSEAMLDLIFSNSSYDLNVIFNWGGSANVLRDCVLGDKQNYVSSYESIRTATETALQKTIEIIEELP